MQRAAPLTFGTKLLRTSNHAGGALGAWLGRTGTVSDAMFMKAAGYHG